jgi:hypothetical protein
VGISGSPIEFSPQQVSGTNEYYDVDAAYSSWEAACYQALDTAKAQHGDELVAGTCPEPVDVDPASWDTQYRSDLVLWLMP